MKKINEFLPHGFILKALLTITAMNISFAIPSALGAMGTFHLAKT
ncbi:hypothetical protein [Kiloniella majae]|nr:hypothetical protein [Kiloniella majae]